MVSLLPWRRHRKPSKYFGTFFMVLFHLICLTAVRDGPNTTTTTIKKKCIWCHTKSAFDGHRMEDLCGFSVLRCVEGAFGASSGGTPKLKNGAPRDELKNGCGRGWAVPYVGAGKILCVSFVNCAFCGFFVVWPCNCLALGDVQTIRAIELAINQLQCTSFSREVKYGLLLQVWPGTELSNVTTRAPGRNSKCSWISVTAFSE